MKKGFTLIELLAVIVILAIIALIATPIVINIINDSQKSAATNSAQLYVDGLMKRIVSENMNGEFNPSSCTISNGNISCDGQSLDYTVDGDKPTSGTITFNNGIVTGYTLGISGYTVTKSGSTITTTKGELEAVSATYTMGQLLQYDPINNTACTTGATCYKWRVITVGDTTSNTTITLQMDHNLVNMVAWASQEDYDDDANYGDDGNSDKGPITALKALETAASTWDDSLKLNYIYDSYKASDDPEYDDSEGYGVLSCTNGACTVAGSQITNNLKARMITVEEVIALMEAAEAEHGYSQFISVGLEWLIENTHADTNSGATSNTYGATNYGYWTLTPVENYFAAYDVNSGGCLDYDTLVYYDDAWGVRPVITISKSMFE